MEKRNFNKMLEEEEAMWSVPPPEIEQRLVRKVHSARVTGDVVDLFLPKIFGTLLQMFGGNSTHRPTPGNQYTDPASAPDDNTNMSR